MNKNAQKGRASLAFCQPVFLLSSASIVGKKEGEGPLGSFFDQVCEDPFFGADTWEAAESAMQKETALLAIKKAGLIPSDLRMIFAGDLLAQSIASSFGIASLGLPFFGLYGACSTMGRHVHCCRLCQSGALRYLQPLCQRGKRISISSVLWQSASPVCHLDCHWKRSLYPERRPSSSFSGFRRLAP